MAVPPPYLVPRWSALASLDSSSAASDSPCFTFAAQRPSGLMLMGRFAPSRGSVDMAGDARSLRLRGDLHCFLREAWRHLQFEAVRVDWIGEFVEANR